MSIDINTSIAGAAQTARAETTQILSTEEAKKSALGALLGGPSVTVGDAGLGDLDTLVEKLKAQSELTKLALLLSSLNTISATLTAMQKATLDKGLALSDKLAALEKALSDESEDYASERASALEIQAKIESLEKQIEAAKKAGEDHNKLVEELEADRKRFDAKIEALERSQGKINEIKNEIASVKGQISAIVRSIGENTVKTISAELAKLTEPEAAERPAETEKAEKKAEETDPFAAIRESLDRIALDMVETVEENRIQNV